MPVAVVDNVNPAPVIYYVQADHLMRPARMTDQRQLGVGRNLRALRRGGLYQPEPGSDGHPHSREWFQLETGLAYNWHRHYDATKGRYVQPDPLGLEALLSDGPSAYNYVGQAALGRVDPRGEWDSRYLGRAAIKAGLAELAGGGPEDPAADILAGLELALGLGQAILAPNPANDNNDCNPECRQIVQDIYKAMDEIRDRIAALLDDKLDLYHLAYGAPNPSMPGAGYWLGHIEQIQGWKNRLINLLDRARRKKCPTPPGARELAGRGLPSQPRGN